MNTQTLCLGILYFGDATGYEINKLASEGRFSHFIEASYGSIYPSLTKLTKQKLVTMREERQDGKPVRKIYAITDLGREALMTSLREETRPDIFKSEFLFVCLFAPILEENMISGVLDRQIRQLEESLSRLSECHEKCSHAASKFSIGYGMALHQAALNYIANAKHLLTNSGETNSAVAAE